MEIRKIIENLEKQNQNIKSNEPMNKHTTFKTGGPAQYFIKIDSENNLKEIIKQAKQTKTPITIIGNGSNILVTDKGIKGITIKIDIKKIEKNQNNKAENEQKSKNEENKIQIVVGAGEKLGTLAQYCLKEELTGMEELSGIPGTIRWSNQNECRSPWKRDKRHNKKCKMYRS